MFIGIDQSKRSTAIVSIDKRGGLVGFRLIRPPMELDQEDLIEYVDDSIRDFINLQKGPILGIAMEGLSFNSVSSGKDLLAGLFWYIRTRLYIREGKYVGVIPVLSWRSKVISIEERRAISALKKPSAIKEATVGKLPFEVKVKFEKHIADNSYNKASIYDLTDAYFVAQHRRGLE